MKLAIVGSRGIPAGYGGFETFAEEISKRLQAAGLDVTVVCQHSDNKHDKFNNVNLIYSGYSKALNPLKFYLDSLRKKPAMTDFLLVCGVGGAIFYPLLNRKSCKLITHVDGREELRGKYSVLKKRYVRIAQAFAAKYSDHIIADSIAVRKYWMEKYNLPPDKVSAIEFGANFVEASDERILNELNLKPGSYFLVVSRMVPENNIEIILKGFMNSGSKLKLVLVGDLTDDFGRSLKRYARDKIIFLNAIYEKAALFSLRKNCLGYIHGHSVGGTNPSLLESMAAGNVCICHDNEFNRETTENKLFYFRDEDDLANRILQTTMLSGSERSKYAEIAAKRISDYYNWERITDEYIKLFNSL